MTKRILVGAVFLVGCAVGGASSQLVVPKASAQQAVQLTKWEYVCDSGLNAAARNELGEQRWEMVGLTVRDSGFTMCFKRPKL